ncbi:Formyltransferase/hydrolase complex subunit D [Planctomycetes bacterium Pan216]|uniref:Formylmethanofuran--tetrahydromethanopterin formyltransferase n=1 Tax=Kolteria novifilia TaxID=2527975 RepID=A0A518B852_9BACT|nr:Formyltransferase/hydrolase complex subunit D [Planctomycetes bacterium Pan216]
MKINNTTIVDEFAEAFPMTASRLLVTAADAYWVEVAARESTGYATSVIGCDAEAGIERWLTPEETPDGRCGVSLLFFGFSRDGVQKAVVNRVGQTLMTCPSTACFDGMPAAEKRIEVGGALRYFGDGYQISKLLEGRRYWRVPVMDGEFLCEETLGTSKGVGGGNFLILGRTQRQTLGAARQAVEAIATLPDVICPFPGGVVRSGSKVGSKYKKLRASTNDAYCPTLRATVASALPDDVHAVYEVVIDGLSEEAVVEATRVGVKAACVEGVVAISAGNYGGNLGPVHIALREILAND